MHACIDVCPWVHLFPELSRPPLPLPYPLLVPRWHTIPNRGITTQFPNHHPGVLSSLSAWQCRRSVSADEGCCSAQFRLPTFVHRNGYRYDKGVLSSGNTCGPGRTSEAPPARGSGTQPAAESGVLWSPTRRHGRDKAPAEDSARASAGMRRGPPRLCLTSAGIHPRAWRASSCGWAVEPRIRRCGWRRRRARRVARRAPGAAAGAPSPWASSSSSS